MGVPRYGWVPKDIYEMISKEVVGQEAAKRAASLIMYNMIEGRRSHAIFCGQTGSGKSEIWRTLAKEFPQNVHIYDANALTATGYSAAGAVHFGDIFNEINRYGTTNNVLVLDEADKAFFSARIGSSGTNWSRVMQEQLLKLLDGDVVSYSIGKGEDARGFDCGRLSVVFLGAFDGLFKAREKRSSIGFDTHQKADIDTSVTREELIKFGAMPEIIGRIARVITMDKPDLDTMRMIARKTIKKMENEYDARIIIHSDVFTRICRDALASGLGARYVRSQVMDLLDCMQFDYPENNEYIIDVPHTAERNLSI